MKIFLTKNTDSYKELISTFLKKNLPNFLKNKFPLIKEKDLPVFEIIEKEQKECDIILDFVAIDKLGTKKEEDIDKYWEELVKIKSRAIKDLKNKNKYKPKPIITLGMWDLMSENKDKNLFNLINIDRKYNFLDSSIWQYYVSLENTTEQKENGKFKTFTENLTNVLTEIAENYELGLYSTNVAREFIEFQTRLMSNSNLIDIDGHANYIAPFIFHSEKKMKILAINELNKLKEKTELGIRWNLLLIDDFSEIMLKGSSKEKLTKKYIINYFLENDFPDGNKDDNKNNLIKLDTVQNIDKAIERIKNKTYDIILLDYLLGVNEEKKRREYGYEFLKHIEDKKSSLKKYKGPLTRFWIFPVSVFSNAMLDRLREQGLNHINQNFFISRGGDPINTPHLYRYNLYKFLNLQIEQTLYTKKSIVEFLSENEIIGTKSSKIDDEVRLWAKRVFGSFIFKFGKREVLEIDKASGSEFAKSVLQFLNDKHKTDYRFYDHVRQLLYLLAYGTGFHVSQMWELSNFVEYEIFERCDNIKDVENLKKSFREYIPKYITRLSRLNS